MSRDPAKDHHPWCNYFMRPREGCQMCDGMWSRYPLDGDKTAAELLAEHFPNVTARHMAGRGE